MGIENLAEEQNRLVRYKHALAFNLCILIYLMTNLVDIEIFIIVKFISGILALIFYPGLIIAEHAHKIASKYIKIGIAFLWGYLLQIMFVTLTYIIFEITHLTIYPQFAISLFTLLFYNTFFIIRREQPGIGISFTRIIEDHRLKQFIVIFSLGIIIRIIMNIITGDIILPDGALYWDFAKNAINTGNFFSTTINDSTTPDFLAQIQVTSIPHIFTSFGIIVTMALTNTSYIAAKLSVFIPSLFIAFPIYEIAKKLFDRSTARFAFILSMFYPILTYFSSLLHGPEMNATAVITLVFLILLDSRRPWDFVKSGVLLGIAEAFWFPLTYVFMIMIPVILLYNSKKAFFKNFKSIFISEIIIGIFILIMLVTSKNLYFAILSNIVAIFLIIMVKNHKANLITDTFLLSTTAIWSKIIQSIGPTIDISYNAIKVEIIKKTIIENTFNPIPDISINIANAFASLFYILIINAGLVISILGIIIIVYSKGQKVGKIFGFVIAVGLSAFTAYLARDPWMYSTAFMYDIGRYFIFLTIILMISSAKYLSIKIGKSKVQTIILISLITISVGFSYYSRINYIQQKDAVTNYGWTNLIPWVKNNTEINSKFFVVQEREFIFYTGRIGIGIIDRYLIDQRMMNISRLINATKIYRPNYIVLDTVFNLSFPLLRQLYNYTVPIGGTIALNETGIFNDLDHAEIKLKLIFMDNSTHLTKLYQIIY